MDTQKHCPYLYGKTIKKGPIIFNSIQSHEKEAIKILIEDCRVLFTPNVFGGDGTETKLNLCLQESGLGAIKIQHFESHLEGNVCSNVKDDYIKCKINLKTLYLFNNSNKKNDNHDVDWVNLKCNALIHIKGKWESKTQIGLQLECTDLQILPDEKISPFA